MDGEAEKHVVRKYFLYFPQAGEGWKIQCSQTVLIFIIFMKVFWYTHTRTHRLELLKSFLHVFFKFVLPKDNNCYFHTNRSWTLKTMIGFAQYRPRHVWMTLVSFLYGLLVKTRMWKKNIYLDFLYGLMLWEKKKKRLNKKPMSIPKIRNVNAVASWPIEEEWSTRGKSIFSRALFLYYPISIRT